MIKNILHAIYTVNPEAASKAIEVIAADNGEICLCRIRLSDSEAAWQKAQEAGARGLFSYGGAPIGHKAARAG